MSVPLLALGIVPFLLVVYSLRRLEPRWFIELAAYGAFWMVWALLTSGV